MPVVVRPEELELSAEPSDPRAISATIVDVAFQGAQRIVRLESQALGPLVASTGGARTLERGAEVAVTFSDGHSWAVPL